MATTTTKTNKPILPRGVDNRPVDSYNRAELYSGKALDFDGVNDYVDLAGFTMSGSVASFSFYVNADNTGNVYFLDANPNRFVLRFLNNKVALFSGSLVEFDAIKANEWTHLVYVLNGTSAKCYANGVQLGIEQTITAIDLSAATDFDLGRWYLGGAYYDGGMAGFKIFNTALTAAQVADLYNNPEKIVPTGVDNTALKLWLPMQEGAGTTAYDGSGNGNHGTINGATWTHGIGAPIAQTAVIDWNKGSNFFNDSSWEVSSAKTNAFVFSSSHIAPNGVDTAAVFDDGVGSTYKRAYKVTSTSMAIGQITASTFVKKKDVDYINVVLGADGGATKIFALVDLVNGTINDTSGSPTATSIKSVGDGWYYVSVQGDQLSSAQGLAYIYGQDPTNGSSVDENYTGENNQTYIWGINIQEGAINNVHLPTIGTSQSSDVLLPQGLTTGRDITGVNLFENVRKQGALNLDGNSWAEVHDNASLDFGAGSFSLEVWAKVKFVDQGSSVNVILNLGNEINSADSAGLAMSNVLAANFWYSSPSGSSVLTQGDWVHIIGVYDETNATLYVNGLQVDQDARNAKNINNALVKRIGRDVGVARFYHDQIAQPRIYNRALTASEVLNNYNATSSLYI